LKPAHKISTHPYIEQEHIMLDTISRGNGSASNINGKVDDAGTDMKALVKDAQSLLTAAASLTGTKADELRERGMRMLDAALDKSGQYKDQAMVKGKELAKNADVYVKDNPWRTVAAAAGVGLLVGVLLGRK
jgi:ElaB/YqjD/DUF883 family membrane-anchored ribosome-binding protein